MPVFFIVGGFANSAWWDSARRSGIGHADWLRTRFARLLRPTVAFVAVWTMGGTVVALAGVDADLVRLGGAIVSLPLASAGNPSGLLHGPPVDGRRRYGGSP